MKTVSLPRLELCGAELASILASTFMTILEVLKHNVTQFAWTDFSTIVLHCLSQLPRTWTKLVAKRVSSIQNVLPRSNWRHVSNPSANSGSIVQLEFVPPYHSPIHTIAVVLERVAKPLPNFTVKSEKLNSLKGIQWANPNFMTHGDIDVILGGEVFEHIEGSESRLSPKNYPQEAHSLAGLFPERCLPTIVHRFLKYIMLH